MVMAILTGYLRKGDRRAFGVASQVPFEKIPHLLTVAGMNRTLHAIAPPGDVG
jgi:hypothetical protein